ncbi:MAG: L-histidine N(alpha)-methyltransferase [Actinomycetota bacterium]|nr:L-histidine N(alpha)-methyltransferase [Actinomycetota bacterium]
MIRTTAEVVDVHLDSSLLAERLERDARDGLRSVPKALPPKWFYDERGSELFEQITKLEEYYPTRREREILGQRAVDVARLTGADTLVELGSGSSAKTSMLLDAMTASGRGTKYVCFDVCLEAVQGAMARLAASYPGVELHGVVGDFEEHLSLLPTGGRRLIAFLGGTVGNLPPEKRRAFMSHLRSAVAPGEHLLLGADLVKDPVRLLSAYDDRGGVTAEFNRNLLRVLNVGLGGNFDDGRFGHVALWDPVEEWIEMRLRSERDQVVDLEKIGLSVPFHAGEEMRTEISCKFRRELLESELSDAGFAVRRWWTDSAGDFSLSLSEAV